MKKETSGLVSDFQSGMRGALCTSHSGGSEFGFLLQRFVAIRVNQQWNLRPIAVTALLAANIQALVRSISSKGSELVLMADQINRHLCAYTPENRFATAFFVVLSHESGELTYVNAGHNAPILSSGRSETYLEPTGMPLGLFREAKFESRTATVPPGTRLLMFTDGLPDGIGGESPERCICDTLRSDAEQTMSALEALIDPKCKFRAN